MSARIPSIEERLRQFIEWAKAHRQPGEKRSAWGNGRMSIGEAAQLWKERNGGGA